jgi:ELWxxDGT repeat protein
MRVVQKSRQRASIEPFETRILLTAQPYFDLAQQTNPSSPTSFTEFDGQVIFTATGDQGSEPYMTDGTPEGTRLLKNFKADVNGRVSSKYFVWNDRAYFTVNRPATGTELWSSDGTTSGTTFLADLTPGSTQSATISGFTPFAGKLYFVSSYSLWRTDGTAAGTQAVFASVLTDEAAADAAPAPLGNELLFYAGDKLRAAEADGSFHIIEPHAGTPMFDIRRVVSADSLVYFNATGGAGEELWVTDGTSAGTHQVADIRAGTNSSAPKVYAAADGKVFFDAFTNTTTRREIFFSAGTDAQTIDLAINTSSGLSSGQYALVNGKFLFAFNDSAGSEPWVSDGTLSGTGRLADLVPGPGSSTPMQFRAVDGQANFFADTSWWLSDGTAAGTHADSRDFAADAPAVLSG